MAAAKTTETMSPGIRKVMNRARDYPQERIYSLAHRVDVPSLGRSFDRVRKGAASGVDGVTKSSFEESLEENLQHLHARLRSGRWRHQPIRRVLCIPFIPSEQNVGDRRGQPVDLTTVGNRYSCESKVERGFQYQEVTIH